jgi:hypothetical protein
MPISIEPETCYFFGQISAELVHIQVVVKTFLLRQLIMRAALDDLTLTEQQVAAISQ